MAISCDKNSLTTAAECFLCLSEKQLRAVRVLLKCAQINGTTLTCNPQTLVNAATLAGYMNMSVKQQMAVETYLDCQITNGGSGSGGVLHGNGSPIANGEPTSPAAMYVDDSTCSLWAVCNGAWTQLIA